MMDLLMMYNYIDLYLYMDIKGGIGKKIKEGRENGINIYIQYYQ